MRKNLAINVLFIYWSRFFIIIFLLSGCFDQHIFAIHCRCSYSRSHSKSTNFCCSPFFFLFSGTFKSSSKFEGISIVWKRKPNTRDKTPFKYINGDSLWRMWHSDTRTHNKHPCSASQCYSNSKIIMMFLLIYSAVRRWRCAIAKCLIVVDVKADFFSSPKNKKMKTAARSQLNRNIWTNMIACAICVAQLKIVEKYVIPREEKKTENIMHAIASAKWTLHGFSILSPLRRNMTEGILTWSLDGKQWNLKVTDSTSISIVCLLNSFMPFKMCWQIEWILSSEVNSGFACVEIRHSTSRQ